MSCSRSLIKQKSSGIVNVSARPFSSHLLFFGNKSFALFVLACIVKISDNVVIGVNGINERGTSYQRFSKWVEKNRKTAVGTYFIMWVLYMLAGLNLNNIRIIIYIYNIIFLYMGMKTQQMWGSVQTILSLSTFSP